MGLWFSSWLFGGMVYHKIMAKEEERWYNIILRQKRRKEYPWTFI